MMNLSQMSSGLFLLIVFGKCLGTPLRSFNININTDKNTNLDFLENAVLNSVLSELLNIENKKPTNNDAGSPPVEPSLLDPSTVTSVLGASLSSIPGTIPSILGSTQPTLGPVAQIEQAANQTLITGVQGVQSVGSTVGSSGSLPISPVVLDTSNGTSTSTNSLLSNGSLSSVLELVTSGLVSLSQLEQTVNQTLIGYIPPIHSVGSDEEGESVDAQSSNEEPSLQSSTISTAEIKMLKDLINDKVRKAKNLKEQQ